MEQDTANVLNTFFSNVVTNLKIPEYADYDPIANNITDPILKVVVRYGNHPGILTIGEVCKKSHKFSFSFSQARKKDILKEIQRLDIKKAAQESDIPSRIIKENSDIFGEYLLSSFNDAIDKSYFPTALKQANINPVFKTGGRYSKDNYRSISILPNVSKIFEKCMLRQMSHFIDNFLSKHQCGFRKGYNTQYCLLKMLEKWKSAVNKGKSFSALLTDSSKAFDCLSHNLLLPKLHSYGFSLSPLKLMHSYLKNRKQRTKIDSTYISWEEILFGVTQRSIQGPLLFNIFLCDLLFLMNATHFASYADDNIPYVTGDSIEGVINSL